MDLNTRASHISEDAEVVKVAKRAGGISEITREKLKNEENKSHSACFHRYVE